METETVNEVSLSGVLARDAELRDTPNSRVAEACRDRTAGTPVRVVGTLRENRWTGKDGKERRKLRVNVTLVAFGDSPEQEAA
jgi:single-stranded DNA-binding protein